MTIRCRATRRILEGTEIECVALLARDMLTRAFTALGGTMWTVVVLRSVIDTVASVIRRLAVLILAGVTVGLVPAALACPPDQHWLSGLHDDADHDDIVFALTSNDATIETQGSPRDRALIESRSAVILPTEQSLFATPRLPSATRAPPV